MRHRSVGRRCKNSARLFFFCAGGVGGAAGDARNDVSEASGSFAWAGGRRDA